MRIRTNKLFLRLIMLVVGGFLLGVGWQYYQMTVYIAQQQREIEQVLKEIKKIEQENKVLEMRLAEMQSPDYLERLARQDYGMIKDGEKVLILHDQAGE